MMVIDNGEKWYGIVIVQVHELLVNHAELMWTYVSSWWQTNISWFDHKVTISNTLRMVDLWSILIIHEQLVMHGNGCQWSGLKVTRQLDCIHRTPGASGYWSAWSGCNFRQRVATGSAQERDWFAQSKFFCLCRLCFLSCFAGLTSHFLLSLQSSIVTGWKRYTIGLTTQ